MTTFNKIIIGAIILLAAGLILVYFVQPSPQVVKEVIKEIGAMPGNELPGPEFAVAGVKSFFVNQSMVTSTGTPCALKAPSASSTLVSASFDFQNASSTAVVLVMAKASTAYATTTQIGNTYLTTTAQTDLTLLASTTAADKAAQDDIFEPNYWLVLSMANSGGTGGPYASTKGTCKAEFRLVK